MNKNNSIITAISVIFILGFLFLVYSATNKPKTADKPIDQTIAQVKTNDHVKWAKEAKHTLIEYSDLQCPACQSYHFFFKPMEASGSADADITRKIKFVYRHFPLRTSHKHAQAAAQAAEAAGKQGKFFEFADELFTTQEDWAKLGNPQEYFEGVAADLALDIDQFKKDFDSKEVKDKINKDYQSGIEAGVNSTPTFYLDGKKVDTATLDEFKKLLKSVK